MIGSQVCERIDAAPACSMSISVRTWISRGPRLLGVVIFVVDRESDLSSSLKNSEAGDREVERPKCEFVASVLI